MVCVVGISPGHPDYLIPLAARRIEEAELLVGGERQLEMFRHLGKDTLCLRGCLPEALRTVAENSKLRRIAVLVSGDPGLFSLLQRLTEMLDPADIEVIPGLSSIQLAYARIAAGWQGARILSVHGRPLDALLDPCLRTVEMAILCDTKNTPARIAAFLLQRGFGNRGATVAERLSYPEERVLRGTLKSIAAGSKGEEEPLSVLIVHAPGEEG
jgi:precorrin-6y C5,15-methyltransferase (decarboxylating) CbiE subunit